MSENNITPEQVGIGRRIRRGIMAALSDDEARPVPLPVFPGISTGREVATGMMEAFSPPISWEQLIDWVVDRRAIKVDLTNNPPAWFKTLEGTVGPAEAKRSRELIRTIVKLSTGCLAKWEARESLEEVKKNPILAEGFTHAEYKMLLDMPYFKDALRVVGGDLYEGRWRIYEDEQGVFKAVYLAKLKEGAEDFLGDTGYNGFVNTTLAKIDTNEGGGSIYLPGDEASKKRLAIGCALSLLFITNTHESADWGVKLKGRQSVSGVRNLMGPLRKFRSIIGINTVTTSEDYSPEEHWGGNLGAYLVNILRRDKSVRQQLRDGTITPFPERCFASPFEYQSLGESFDTPLIDKNGRNITFVRNLLCDFVPVTAIDWAVKMGRGLGDTELTAVRGLVCSEFHEPSFDLFGRETAIWDSALKVYDYAMGKKPIEVGKQNKETDWMGELANKQKDLGNCFFYGDLNSPEALAWMIAANLPLYDNVWPPRVVGTFVKDDLYHLCRPRFSNDHLNYLIKFFSMELIKGDIRRWGQDWAASWRFTVDQFNRITGRKG